MSDRPLFQNMDEQEATYSGDRSGEPDAPGSVIIPGAAAAGGALSGQLGTAGATAMGAAPAAGSVIAGANRSTNEDRDDDGVIDNDEAQQARS